MKKLVDLEEDIFAALADRQAKRNPEWLTSLDPVKAKGLDGFLLDHWPSVLLPRYWDYLFGNPEGVPWVQLWSPITDLYEMRYWFKSRGWRWMWDETRMPRIVCRIRRHPNGPIYYNAGEGYEPDWRCKDCGDVLG